jgi:hypothetical protein
MDDRTVLGADEKSEMRELVLAGAARADSIRRRRARIAAAVPAVLVVVGIVVGAGFASGMLGRGSVVPADPGPSTSTSPSPEGETHPFNGIAAFDRPATASDALPALPDYTTENLKVETARYVGEYEDVAYWVVQSMQPGSVCIVMSPLGKRTDWLTGCGGMPVTVEGAAEATLAPAGMAPEGWVQLDENLSVKPSSLGSDLD